MRNNWPAGRRHFEKGYVMAKLLLFDVDQTILTTKGGDRKALNMAFKELFGIEDGFKGIEFAGRMDLAIVKDALRIWGMDHILDPDVMAKFKSVYFKLLEDVLGKWSEGYEYPGVRVLLECLSRRGDVDIGLITGNFRESAFIKLRRYGFDMYFCEGGFGGDSEERPQVVNLAIQRCEAKKGVTYARGDMYVIGDSPADILAGQANSIRTVAVATGYSSLEKLQTYGPTHIFHDLSDIEAFVAQTLTSG